MAVDKPEQLVVQSGVREPDTPGSPTAWHALTVQQICQALDCDLTGLNQTQADKRLENFGPNRLPEIPPVPDWIIFLRQFQSPFIYILILAALISLSLEMMDDAIFILMVLIINAVIGFLQESRAEKDIQSLGKLLGSSARVQRNGHIKEIDTTLLVPGDLIWVEPGMRIPADIRLLVTHGLRVDQSLITGESLPVEKLVTDKLTQETAISEQGNMIFSGCTVIHGKACGLVVETGVRSQAGLIAEELKQEGIVKPPLALRMEQFTRVVAFSVLGLSLFICLIGIVHGLPWHEMMMAAIALSVSAIPEGLPVALTVALAIGLNRMARQNVLVRRLEAVEALGSCSVICTDKTGTLTANQLTVVYGSIDGLAFSVSGTGYQPSGDILIDNKACHAKDSAALYRLCRAAALCNDASLVGDDGLHQPSGDPIDLAMLVFAYKAGIDSGSINRQYPRTNEIPFESERRFAATFHHQENNQGLTLVKGAPEKIIPMCQFALNAQNSLPEQIRPDEVWGWLEALTLKGFRVLAMADSETSEPVLAEAIPGEPQGLTLLGFVGMTDPPREGVANAIQQCRSAGIHVQMITGDHQHTARAIAEQIGLSCDEDEIMDGSKLQTLGEGPLLDVVEDLTIISRASPVDKLHIVRALRQRGRYVAVTGDGVNDAPALKAANIGIAMGKGGTDIAREASDLVITDDNFATIVSGIKEGRITYSNVRKVIFLLLSTGLGELLAVLLVIMSNMPVPFLPAQLLWLNLVTNGIQDIALAFEPGESDALDKPPRPESEGVLNRIMVERILLSAIVFGTISFFAFRWMLDAGYSTEDSRGMLLNLFVVFEVMQLGNARSENRSVFLINPFSNPLLLLGTFVAVSIHLLALNIPFMSDVLGATMPSVSHWLWLILLASSIIIVMELHKLYRNLKPINGSTIHG